MHARLHVWGGSQWTEHEKSKSLETRDVLSLGVTRGVHRADVLGEHGVRDARGRRAVADDGDVEGGARVRARVGAAPVLRLGLGLGYGYG